MNYKELEAEIEKGNIKEGDTVWICDYRLNDNLDARPIRHVVPTEVIIISNEKLPKNKRVFYSIYHFRTLTKKREASSIIIAPYDNTGYRYTGVSLNIFTKERYRGYTGVSLNIFTKETDCRKCFKKQCLEVKEKIEIKKKSLLKTIELMEDEVEENINLYC